MKPFHFNRIRRVLSSGLASGLLLALPVGYAQQTTSDNPAGASSPVQSADEAGAVAASLKEVARFNLTAIQFAELAADKAKDPELKRFGQSLQNRHKNAQAKLDILAQKHNVSLPKKLDPKDEQQLNKLRELSGHAFDKEYARGAIDGYATALAHLENQDREKQAPDVAQYTKEVQRQLRDDLQKAREIAKAVGLDDAMISSLEGANKATVGAAAGSEKAQGSGTSTDTTFQPKEKQP